MGMKTLLWISGLTRHKNVCDDVIPNWYGAAAIVEEMVQT